MSDERLTIDPAQLPRFDGNTRYYWLGLLALCAGLWLEAGPGLALTVGGAIMAAVSLINSWIVVWIATRGGAG